MHDYRLSSRWEKIVANPICMSSHSFLSAYLLLDEIRKCTFNISYRLNIIMHLWSRLEFIFGGVRQSCYMFLCSSFMNEMNFFLWFQWNNSQSDDITFSLILLCASWLADAGRTRKAFRSNKSQIGIGFSSNVIGPIPS